MRGFRGFARLGFSAWPCFYKTEMRSAMGGDTGGTPMMVEVVIFLQNVSVVGLLELTPSRDLLLLLTATITSSSTVVVLRLLLVLDDDDFNYASAAATAAATAFTTTTTRATATATAATHY